MKPLSVKNIGYLMVDTAARRLWDFQSYKKPSIKTNKHYRLIPVKYIDWHDIVIPEYLDIFSYNRCTYITADLLL